MGLGKRLSKKAAMSAAAGGLAIGVSLLFASPAWAASATGCSGTGTSINRAGHFIDEASAPGAGGTESHPLKIDSKGTVQYQGSTQGVIRDGTWTVEIYGVQVASGKISNHDGKTTVSGVAKMKKYLHFFGSFDIVTGEYEVKVNASGGGATCSVDGYIDIEDSPFQTPLLYVAGFLLLIAILLWIFWGRPEALMDIVSGDYDAAVGDALDSMGPG